MSRDSLFRVFVKSHKCTFVPRLLSRIVGSNYKSVDEYRSIVKSKLDIELNEIKFNPGMRSIAKLCLNSLWGKIWATKQYEED